MICKLCSVSLWLLNPDDTLSIINIACVDSLQHNLKISPRSHQLWNSGLPIGLSVQYEERYRKSNKMVISCHPCISPLFLVIWTFGNITFSETLSLKTWGEEKNMILPVVLNKFLFHCIEYYHEEKDSRDSCVTVLWVEHSINFPTATFSSLSYSRASNFLSCAVDPMVQLLC